MTARTCSAIKHDGSPCNAYALTGSDYCYHHDPQRAAERCQARRKGGRARHGRTVGPVGVAPTFPLDTMADVTVLLQHAINQTLRLENSIARARTLGYLAGLLIKALEVAGLEERMLLLERVLQSREDPS